jgi:aminopeptidase-like protein
MDEDRWRESLNYITDLISAIETDLVPFSDMVGPISYSRHGVYHCIEQASEKFEHVEREIDGKKRISELASMAGLSYEAVEAYMRTMKKAGLLDLRS